MKALIKINSENADRPTVLGRELHKALEVKTPYTMWFSRMCDYGFSKNTDYILVSQICETNNPKNPTTEIANHQLTLDMAKARYEPRFQSKTTKMHLLPPYMFRKT